MKKHLLFSPFLLLIGSLHAATITAQNSTSHRWNDAATWVGGVLPADGDNVVIPAGVIVNTVENVDDPGFDISFQILSVNIPQITVIGTLQLGDPGQDVAFAFSSPVTINVQSGGRLVDTTSQDQFNSAHPDYHDLLFQNDSYINLDDGATLKTQNPTYIYETNETYDNYTLGNLAFNDPTIGPLNIIILDGVALPVKLYDLTGQYDAGSVLLNWKTSSEQNNAFFEVQRSTDGITFTTIGQVPGAATSGAVHNYSYTDYAVNKMGATVLFYRLRQVDIDGKSTYYGIVKIVPGQADASLKLWPNPNSGRFLLSLGKTSGGTVTMNIINQLGQLISRREVQEPQLSIDLSGKAKGLYFIQLNYQDGHQQVLRTVVQ